MKIHPDAVEKLIEIETKREDLRQAQEYMRIGICPKCGSSDVGYYFHSDDTGLACNRCKFSVTGDRS